jgi:hypothetical protein
VRERSTNGILEALRSRRMWASTGERLDLWLEQEDGRVAILGERTAAPDGWIPRTQPAAEVTSVDCADGSRCVFAVLRDDQGAIAAVTAPIWISTSQ